MYFKSKLTVVIPTYNRRDRLKRALRYWKDHFQVIVADGSDSDNSDLIPKDFLYYHDSRARLVDRWVSAIKLVQTEFVLICADDDFVGIEAANKCVEFLDKNQDYSCAQGLYCGFGKNPDISYNSLYKNIHNYPLTDSDPIRRLVDSFSYYFHSIYSIQRTSNCLKFLEGFPKLTNDNSFEMQFTLGNACFGKHKIFEFLYGAREIIPNSAGRTTPSIVDWKKSDLQSFHDWRNYCSKLIQREVPGIVDGGLVFDQAFSGYCGFLEDYYGRKHAPTAFNKIKNRTKNLVKKFIPSNLLAKFRPKNLNLLTGWEPDLVEMTRRLYGEESVPDAIRIQNAIFAESNL